MNRTTLAAAAMVLAGAGHLSCAQRGGYLLVVSTTLPERKHYSTTSPMLGRGSVSLVMNKAESQESSSFHNPGLEVYAPEVVETKEAKGIPVAMS